MNDNLYFIANSCHEDVTCGLARISDEDFPKFKTIIEDLNKNSCWGGMPTIRVYKISMDVLREFKYDPLAAPWERAYVDEEETFYLDGKTYTFKEEDFLYFNELELVISGAGRKES